MGDEAPKFHVAGQVTISEQLLQDSGPPLDELVMYELSREYGLAVDAETLERLAPYLEAMRPKPWTRRQRVARAIRSAVNSRRERVAKRIAPWLMPPEDDY